MGAADKEEMFDVVDGKNRTIGKEKRSIVHKNGLFHRAVHVFIFNSGGEVFLQKRVPEKLICPSKWDLSAAEHLERGEDYLHGALRGIKEELSIKIKTLKKIRGPRLQKLSYPSSLQDNEFVELFRGVHEGTVIIDKKEIESGGFFKVDDVKRMIKDNPDQFTPWFLNEWKWLEDNDLV